MPRTHRRPGPPRPAHDFLRAALRPIARDSLHAHARRRDRLAVAFVPHPRRAAGLTDGAVPIDEIRLVVLSFRVCDDGAGGLAAREPLAVYRPVRGPDPAGRVRFACEAVYDLRSRPGRGALVPRVNLDRCRDAVVMHRAVADAPPGAFTAGPRAPRFGPSESPHATESGGSPDARVGYAVFDPGLRDRAGRGPAWGVLTGHGALPAGDGHRAWLDHVGRTGDGGRAFPDPDLAGSRTGRVRAAIESFVSARAGRQEPIMRDLLAACRALGVPVPPDPRAADDFLVDLLDAPWLPVGMPGQGAVQLVDAASSNPEGAAGLAGVDIDLDDFGAESRRYARLSRRVVRESLRRRGRANGLRRRAGGDAR